MSKRTTIAGRKIKAEPARKRCLCYTCSTWFTVPAGEFETECIECVRKDSDRLTAILESRGIVLYPNGKAR
jgi:Zn finger protein HypA/HybF involved in hydrogenase expression